MGIICQLALVSEVPDFDFSEVTRTSAALQKQVTRDFSPIWNIEATVDGFAKLEDVPLGYWPIIIETDIQQQGALGVHLDKDGQPFALVQLTDTWQLTVSHEALEMLVDPYGSRLVAGDSPKPNQGRVQFLVEVCDPCEAAEFGYTLNGITLSDFYTPEYFDPVQAIGVRYSFTGALKEPRQVLKGGYLSWQDPVSDHWWQETFFDGAPEFRDLGPLTAQRVDSLRGMIDRLTNELALKSMVREKSSLVAAARAYPQTVGRPSERKAQAIRAQIAGYKAQAPEENEGRGPPRRRPPRRGNRT
jgi:hypothetical protein